MKHIFTITKWHLSFYALWHSASPIKKLLHILSGVFAHGGVYFPKFYKKLNFCWALIIFCKKNGQTYLHKFRVNDVAENIGYKAFLIFFFCETWKGESSKIQSSIFQKSWSHNYRRNSWRLPVTLQHLYYVPEERSRSK